MQELESLASAVKHLRKQIESPDVATQNAAGTLCNVALLLLTVQQLLEKKVEELEEALLTLGHLAPAESSRPRKVVLAEVLRYARYEWKRTLEMRRRKDGPSSTS